jgi:hypothetical protein
MASALHGSRDAISDGHAHRAAGSLSSLRRGLAVFGLALLLIAGCDSESLVNGDSGHLDTALRLLGPEGTVVGYADIEALDSHADIWIESITGRTPPRDEMISEFEKRTGIDFENDVDALYVTLNADAERREGSVIVFGGFDADEVIGTLEMQDGLTPVDHSGPSSFTAYLYEGQDSVYVAVSTDGLIVMTSDGATFDGMMARADGSGTVVTADEPFLDELSTYDAWISGRILPLIADRMQQFGGEMQMIVPVLESVRRAGAGIDLTDETAEAVILLEPRSDVRADDLANVLRGGIAAARFQLMNDSEAPQALIDLLDRIEVETTGDAVSVAVFARRTEIVALTEDVRNSMP